MAQLSLKNSRLYIHYLDGSDNPQYEEVRIGEGNVTWSEKRTIEYTLDRGNLRFVSASEGGAAREGDDQPVDVSFDLLWDETSVRDPEAVIKGEPNDEITAIKSAHSADPCAPHAVHLELIYLPDCEESEESIVHYVLPYFRWESINSDVTAGQISCSGTCQSKAIYKSFGGGSTPDAFDIIAAAEA